MGPEIPLWSYGKNIIIHTSNMKERAIETNGGKKKKKYIYIYIHTHTHTYNKELRRKKSKKIVYCLLKHNLKKNTNLRKYRNYISKKMVQKENQGNKAILRN